ncbi:uncharacterized protein PGTG_13201 [Puccinia graminis f. sp. tritici CRL 75-36-700-3]|uniref:Uncharacterized protein n=1 Tax=Puccinia graminis f. sp. tritici (strain CRL 75-36-700-3 / race SCCL) TaxID=418459 RepID=E3KR94_PUCGT|nr:uncharacterized protein PGTG_13201 [Puccinia graminis f. sp. tritici CRL 75-36-700-3]EFP86819.1 hypothetical protein PGTG_13201 [Puccinia graminis f. sp. tritici CRL 75-36-700-3]
MPASLAVNNVHASLSLDPPKWSKKTQKKSSEVYINHISQKLNRLSFYGSKANDEGPDRLAWMIVRDLSDIFHSGRIEFEKAWDKYMVKDRFSRKNSNLPNILPEEEEILGTLYNWLKGGRHGWSKYQRDLTQQWAVSRVRKLKEFKMTKGTVRVAVDFHTFAMAWHCSRVYDSIGVGFRVTNDFEAYALAISRSCHWQPRGFEDHSIIEVIEKTPIWRKSDNCATSEEYLKVLMAMENPHSAPPLEISPKLGQYDVDSCYLDILNKFNHLSQILNLSFIHEDTTDDEDLKFLMEAFQDFCGYFLRGNPFDNSFKYHQLVFRIGSKVRDYLGIRTEKLSGSTIEKSGMAMSKKQSKSSEKTLIEEIEAFYCKTRLVMRHVEEFSQTVKQKGFISVFHPKPRASLAQLRHLDFNEEAVVYNINKQLEIHEFPASIQHSMLGIMGNKHYSFENLKESLLPSIREAGQTQLEAVETFYENLEFLVSKMKNKSTPLIVWEQVFLAVKQELSSSSSENADKLIKVLKHGHLIRRNIPVLHHIYLQLQKADHWRNSKS